MVTLPFFRVPVTVFTVLPEWEIVTVTLPVSAPGASEVTETVALIRAGTEYFDLIPVTLIVAFAFATVSFDAEVETLPAALVKVARYRAPLSERFAVNFSSLDIAPVTAFQVSPLSALRSHITDGVGIPDAFARRVTVFPTDEDTVAAGFCSTTGFVCTWMVLAPETASPRAFEKTARNCALSSPASAVKTSSVVAAPATGDHEAPLSLLRCHTTVGVGEPVASADS